MKSFREELEEDFERHRIDMNKRHDRYRADMKAENRKWNIIILLIGITLYVVGSVGKYLTEK